MSALRRCWRGGCRAQGRPGCKGVREQSRRSRYSTYLVDIWHAREVGPVYAIQNSSRWLCARDPDCARHATGKSKLLGVKHIENSHLYAHDHPMNIRTLTPHLLNNPSPTLRLSGVREMLCFMHAYWERALLTRQWCLIGAKDAHSVRQE